MSQAQRTRQLELLTHQLDQVAVAQVKARSVGRFGRVGQVLDQARHSPRFGADDRRSPRLNLPWHVAIAKNLGVALHRCQRARELVRDDVDELVAQAARGFQLEPHTVELVDLRPQVSRSLVDPMLKLLPGRPEVRVGHLELFDQLSRRARKRRPLNGSRNRHSQKIGLEGLDQTVVGASTQRVQRRVWRWPGQSDQRDGLRRVSADLGEQPAFRGAFQVFIDQNHVEAGGLQAPHRLVDPRGEAQPVSLATETGDDSLERLVLSVNGQDARLTPCIDGTPASTPRGLGGHSEQML